MDRIPMLVCPQELLVASVLPKLCLVFREGDKRYVPMIVLVLLVILLWGRHDGLLVLLLLLLILLGWCGQRCGVVLGLVSEAVPSHGCLIEIWWGLRELDVGYLGLIAIGPSPVGALSSPSPCPPVVIPVSCAWIVFAVEIICALLVNACRHVGIFDFALGHYVASPTAVVAGDVVFAVFGRVAESSAFFACSPVAFVVCSASAASTPAATSAPPAAPASGGFCLCIYRWCFCLGHHEVSRGSFLGGFLCFDVSQPLGPLGK